MSDCFNTNSKGYTDRDMQVISELAYITYSSNMIGKTFSEILSDDESYKEFTQQFLKGLDNPEAGTDTEKNAIWKKEVLEQLKAGGKYSNWKLVGTSSNVDGFYAIMVETDPDNAVVAFRGTQMSEEPFQDLVLADLLLLNNTETLQQESARTYITAINEQYDCSNYVVAGHSLGGNLAMHSPIKAA